MNARRKFRASLQRGCGWAYMWHFCEMISGIGAKMAIKELSLVEWGRLRSSLVSVHFEDNSSHFSLVPH